MVKDEKFKFEDERMVNDKIDVFETF